MIRTCFNHDPIGFLCSNVIVLYTTFIHGETKPYLKNTFDKVLIVVWICVIIYYAKEMVIK